MKQMRRIMCIVLASLMIFALTACGGSEPQTVFLTYEQDGVSMEYQLDAVGDIVEKLTQTSSIDCSMYTEEQMQIFEESISDYAAAYENIDGVSYSTEIIGTDLVETISIDATNSDTLDTLSSQGLLPIEGTSSSISLEKTVENLESQGWVVQE